MVPVSQRRALDGTTLLQHLTPILPDLFLDTQCSLDSSAHRCVLVTRTYTPLTPSDFRITGTDNIA